MFMENFLGEKGVSNEMEEDSSTSKKNKCIHRQHQDFSLKYGIVATIAPMYQTHGAICSSSL